MKNIFSLIIFLQATLIIPEVFSQDIIVLRNTNEITSKVLEITENQVKYKKFDNIDGPAYSINKSEVFYVKYQNGSKDVFDTNPEAKTVTSTKESKIKATEIPLVIPANKARVIVYRPGSPIGIAVGFDLVANGTRTARIKNGTYYEYFTNPGQYAFTTSLERSKIVNVDLEPGKTYFLKTAVKMGALTPGGHIELVDEKTGEEESKKLKDK